MCKANLLKRKQISDTLIHYFIPPFLQLKFHSPRKFSLFSFLPHFKQFHIVA